MPVAALPNPHASNLGAAPGPSQAGLRSSPSDSDTPTAQIGGREGMMMAGLYPANVESPRHRLTNHAARRLRQRAVPVHVLDWLDRFGAEAHEPGGVTITFFDKRARRLLARLAARHERARLDHWLDAYAVEARDGALVTVGWRHRRINRK